MDQLTSNRRLAGSGFDLRNDQGGADLQADSSDVLMGSIPGSVGLVERVEELIDLELKDRRPRRRYCGLLRLDVSDPADHPALGGWRQRMDLIEQVRLELCKRVQRIPGQPGRPHKGLDGLLLCLAIP